MTILSDILAAMYVAPSKPIGLILGNSGWHAFHAAQHHADREDEGTREFLSIIARLSISRTTAFGGFDLILGDAPNHLGGFKRSAAA